MIANIYNQIKVSLTKPDLKFDATSEFQTNETILLIKVAQHLILKNELESILLNELDLK